MRQLLLLIPCVFILSACGGLEVPSFLGRDGDGDASITLGEDTLSAEPVGIPLVSARAERALGGFFVHAEGLGPTQGYHSARLTPDGQGDGSPTTINLSFRAVPPDFAEPVGPDATRELRAAVFLPETVAEDIRSIRITGSNGARTVTLP